MTLFVILLITLAASTLGAICGIGGGVVIKPVLDATGMVDVSAGSFLSGCTVLCMTAYSVAKNLRDRTVPIQLKLCVPIAAGAAIGGVFGKALFQEILRFSAAPSTVGIIQSVCLFLLTLGTFLYTLNKDRIRTQQHSHAAFCFGIGLLLAIFSSFLGIGGGPFNLVFLSFFFSMGTKEAAQASLFIILLSQVTSLCSTVLSNQVPVFDLRMLAGMAFLGILGGILGRRIQVEIPPKTIDRLFMGMTLVIMGICIYNVFK